MVLLTLTGDAGAITPTSATIDQDLDVFVLGLVVEPLRGEQRKVVDAGVQVHGLAHAGIVLDEGDLGAAGGLGLPMVKPLLLALTPAIPENCQGQLQGATLVSLRKQCRRREAAVADAAIGQGGDRQQFSAFETFHRQPPRPGGARRGAWRRLFVLKAPKILS